LPVRARSYRKDGFLTAAATAPDQFLQVRNLIATKVKELLETF
jgi:hypothetical protein